MELVVNFESCNANELPQSFQQAMAKASKTPSDGASARAMSSSL